ncbi:MAG: SCO family protein [Xanthomonadales bacterium]|nr:SCO family protein [Gammaproteobacteria bacterium]MBT8055189.1 SCO family protein [Gammaproteobacteria bacterium]NND55815.1 SCO family protein [Xanthomonadales bacterium]NNK51358.1 SCO family protein [Xanthomonadales bacterium]
MTESSSKGATLRLVALAILVGAISAVGGISLWNVLQGPEKSASSSSTLMILPEPRVIADFALVDDQNRPFTLENLRGHWTVLFFGFTHCPDICPSALYDLNLVSQSLGELAGETPPDVRFVFVSIDPERDTPEKLAQYVGYFNPEFTGVTGPEEQLAPMAMQLGIAYQIEPHDPGAEQYDVYHTASFLLTDPDGRLHGVFPAPHDAQKITHDLAAAID